MAHTYQGIDLSAFGGELNRVVLLGCTHDSATFSEEQCAEIRRSDVSFAIRGDFNQDSVPDVARVAAAIARNGQAVAVLFIGPAADPSRHQALVVAGEHFSAITHQHRLSWFFCIACDFGADVVWNDVTQSYYLVWIESDV